MIVSKEGDEPCRLQAGQGDTLSGRVSRDEVGATVAAALNSPYAAGKTFELRRDEVRASKGGELREGIRRGGETGMSGADRWSP